MHTETLLAPLGASSAVAYGPNFCSALSLKYGYLSNTTSGYRCAVEGGPWSWPPVELLLPVARRRLLSVCALVCHYNASLRQFFTFCPLVRGRPKAPAVHAFFQTFIFPDHTFGAFISLFARALFTARALAYLRGGLGVVYETHQSARAL